MKNPKPNNIDIDDLKIVLDDDGIYMEILGNVAFIPIPLHKEDYFFNHHKQIKRLAKFLNQYIKWRGEFEN